MSKLGFFTKILFPAVILLCSAGLYLAFANQQTQTEKLTVKAPDDCIAFIAFEGTDNVKKDFDKTSLGQLLNDPSVKTFFSQIFDDLLKNITVEIEQEDPVVAMVLNNLPNILKTPLIIGAGYDNASQSPVPVYGFLIANAEKNKQQIDEGISSLTDNIPLGRKVMKIISGYDLNYTLVEDVDVYWGWADKYFVFAVNDPQGLALNNLKKNTDNSYLSGINTENSTAAFYADTKRLTTIFSDALEMSPEDFKNVKTVMDKLGLSKVKSYKANLAFEGKDIVTESFLEVPLPHTGLLQYLKPTDLSQLDYFDANALAACSINIDFVGIYDLMLEIAQEVASEDEYNEFIQGISELESEMELSLRNDILNCLSAPLNGYSLATETFSSVPFGGLVFMIKPNDSKAIDYTLKKICEIINKELPKTIQLETQEIDGVTYNKVISMAAAMFQIVPTWASDGENFVLASNVDLCNKTIQQIKTGKEYPSLANNTDFKTQLTRLPKNVNTFIYTNSTEYFKQSHIQMQQVWPMLSMSLATQGVNLPYSIPNIPDAVNDMPPSYSYSWMDGRGLHSKSTGFAMTPDRYAVPALAVGILMPALAKTREQAQVVVSGSNLSGIGKALMIYANDNNENYPEKLEELIEYADLSPKQLISARAPEGFNEPHFIYIAGQKTPDYGANILAYENPKFGYSGINVLYNNGLVSFETPQEFRKYLKKTYDNLGREMPEIVFPDD